MSRSKRPISNFVADLLHLALSIIVMGVVVAIINAENSGDVINPVSTFSKMAHQVLIDLKDGWNNIN